MTDVLHHFLHIGKTGGTALKHAIESAPTSVVSGIRLHNHGVTLAMIPDGERVFFTIRDPIDRFLSSFFSRWREGKPRYNVPWTADERIAFGRFDTPNKLALALSSGDKEERTAAEHAMRSIGHIKSSYWDWFVDEAYFDHRAADIAFIARQEHLNDDFDTLKRMLGLPTSLRLPKDDISAHRNPRNADRRLDPIANRNLAAWYARDYAFLKICQEMKATHDTLGALC